MQLEPTPAESYSATSTWRVPVPTIERARSLIPGLIGPEATLRGWLIVGAISLVVLFGAAIWTGYSTVEERTRWISEELADVERSAEFAADLEATIRQQIELGTRYLESGDPALRATSRPPSRSGPLSSSSATVSASSPPPSAMRWRR